MDHSIKAGELFLSGASCSQAVVLAFSDVTGLDERLSLRVSALFLKALNLTLTVPQTLQQKEKASLKTLLRPLRISWQA